MWGTSPFPISECRSIYLNQQKKGVDVCHDFELRASKHALVSLSCSMDATSYHCHFPGTSFLRSSPKSQLYSRRKLYEYSRVPHTPKSRKKYTALPILTLHEKFDFSLHLWRLQLSRETGRFHRTEAGENDHGTSFPLTSMHKESTFFSTSSTHVWGTRNYLSVHGKSEIFRTQSALQDRDQNLTCSEVDAELGAKKLLLNSISMTLKLGIPQFACSPIPRKYRI